MVVGGVCVWGGGEDCWWGGSGRVGGWVGGWVGEWVGGMGGGVGGGMRGVMGGGMGVDFTTCPLDGMLRTDSLKETGFD